MGNRIYKFHKVHELVTRTGLIKNCPWVKNMRTVKEKGKYMNINFYAEFDLKSFVQDNYKLL